MVFTDDDCEPWPEWIEHVTAPFSDGSVGVVTGRVAGQPRNPLGARTPAVRFPDWTWARSADGVFDARQY